MEFDYFSENYRNFEKTFNDIYAGEEPLFSIVDDLERAMSKDKPYFILPGSKAKDGMQHVFYFEVVGDKYVYSHLI